jgi:hypothetical protein
MRRGRKVGVIEARGAQNYDSHHFHLPFLLSQHVPETAAGQPATLTGYRTLPLLAIPRQDTAAASGIRCLSLPLPCIDTAFGSTVGR